jgi:ABC-type multidrug transport system fused ATPase/permease subunit
MTNTRISNLELLRILGMILIVYSHIISLFSVQFLNHPVLTLVGNEGGRVGNSLFFIISGYFATKINWKRFKKILTPLLFYSIFWLFIYFILFKISPSLCYFSESPIKGSLTLNDVFDRLNFFDVIHFIINPGIWYSFGYLFIIGLFRIFFNIIKKYPILCTTLFFCLFCILYIHKNIQNLMYSLLANIPILNFLIIPLFMSLQYLWVFCFGYLIKQFNNKILFLFLILQISFSYFTNLLVPCGAMIFSLLLFKLFIIIKPFKIHLINKISKTTYDVYLFHATAPFGLFGILRNPSLFNPISTNVFLSLIFLPIIIFIISLILYYFRKKILYNILCLYCPKLKKTAKGIR